MRVVTTNVYSFNELSKAAQENAIEHYQNESNEVFLDSFKEDCLSQIEEVGFYDNVKLQYELSYSKGDGLSFSCDRIETKTLLPIFVEILGEGKEKTAKIIIDNCRFENTGNKGRNCFASKNDIDFNIERYGGNEVENCNIVVAKVLEKLESLYINLCKELETKGYAEIEFQNSLGYVSDYFISNEIEFTIDGERF
jgi:hypothetical protein